MKKFKKLTALVMAGALTASMLMGCSPKGANTSAKGVSGSSQAVSGTEDSKSSSTPEKKFKIGVIQYIQHDALDSSNKGFFAALDEAGIQYEVDQQNASGDASACQTIAETLANSGNDLVLAIATPAAQSAAGIITDIPVIITAVTDPAESGLLADNSAPGGNVTGTSDLTPVADQIELLRKTLPDAKKVGILYCTSESNSEIQGKLAEEACAAADLESKLYTVSSSNEIQQVVESMVGDVDVIYAPTDNVIAAGMPTVSMVATENKLPVICGEGGMVSKGGLCTYGIDYYKLGYMAGEQAVAILKGEKKPAETPVGYLSKEECTFAYNSEIAKALEIDEALFEGAEDLAETVQ